MNSNKKLSRHLDDNVFSVQSPLLEDYFKPMAFGEIGTIDRDPRRATVTRKVRECIDAFLDEKHCKLSMGYFIIDKELFVEHLQDTIHINFKDPAANTAVTATGIVTAAPKGIGFAVNTAVNTKELLDFFKMHRSELEKRLNEKCRGFVVTVEHDFVNYLTITLKEKRMDMPKLNL